MPNNALLQIKQNTLNLIDDLKVICADKGLKPPSRKFTCLITLYCKSNKTPSISLMI
ncbi:hypothetical protein E5L24_02200 [Helicobacter pylori]|nr:hypothetical protein E5L24_02200 [Helicobacter pylori]